jgi:hypothetical protein
MELPPLSRSTVSAYYPAKDGMETLSGTYVHATQREYAIALVEIFLRDVRRIEQQYPAVNCGLSTVCELAFGRISDTTLVEKPLPTPPAFNPQVKDPLMANLESRWRLGLVPLREYRTERHHLSRRVRLVRFEGKPALGYAVDAIARLLEWFEGGLVAISALTERVLPWRFKSLS